jgi:hypothetical protein
MKIEKTKKAVEILRSARPGVKVKSGLRAGCKGCTGVLQPA